MNSYSKKELDKFNTEFERKVIDKPILKCMDKNDLDKRNILLTEKSITDLTVAEILIGIKDTWFGMTDDLIHLRISRETATKNNRLFFIGLTLVIIILLLFLYEYLIEGDDSKTKEVVIKHIYKLTNDSNKDKQMNKVFSDAFKNIPALATGDDD